MKDERRFVVVVLVIGVVFGLSVTSEAELIRLKVSAPKIDCLDVPAHATIQLPERLADVPVEQISVRLIQLGNLFANVSVPGQIVMNRDKKTELWWVMPRVKANSITMWTAVLSRREKSDKEVFSWRDKEGEYLDLVFGGRKVTRYMYAYDNSTPQRAFETYKPLHHVFDAEGENLLTNGPDGLRPYLKENIKYPHHRGIFIGWNRLEFGGKKYDFWHMKDATQVHQKFLEQTAGPVLAKSRSLVHWDDKNGRTIIAEERETTVFRQGDPTVLLLEFRTELKAVSSDVFLDGDPEHAGFQYRPHDDVAKGGKEAGATYLFHKEGIKDRIKTHEDKDLPWVGMSYGLGGRRYSVEHINHPDNPKPTIYSAYRDYGRFGAFFKKEIKAGETLTLRYRIWVIEGEMPERQELEDRYSAFVDAPKVEIQPRSEVAVTALVGPAVEKQPVQGTALKLVTKETSLGKLYPHTAVKTLAVSPDSKRVAYADKRGGKCFVVVDGVESEEYDNIAQFGPVLIPDGRHATSTAFTFSPDSKRVAYVARRGRKCFAVVDGVESEEYDNIAELGPVLSPDGRHATSTAFTFSPDSKRVAYVAGRGEKAFIVADGVESTRYDAIGGGPVFSADGKRLAYGAMRGGEWFAVVDGVEGKGYDAVAEFRFSADGKRLAHCAWRGGKWVDERLVGRKVVVVVDGVEGNEYDGLGMGTLIFSPDARRLAYGARRGKKYFVVADGVESTRYDAIVRGGPVFSADGKRLAYAAQRGEKEFVVVDGIEGKQYDWITEPAPVFSADGKRLAYIARRGAKHFVVADGVEGKMCDWIWGLIFSPDGKRLAYNARRGEKAFIVVDGVEAKAYDSVGDPVFSPDSRHVAYWAWRGGKRFVVVDGVEGKEYERFLRGLERPPLAFDGPNSLNGLVQRDEELLLVHIYVAAH